MKDAEDLKAGSGTNVRKRAHAVAEALRAYVEGGVESGELKPGQRLPTERELMELFGGGRNIVRKTLIALEDEGKIVRQVGSGTYVADPAEQLRQPGNRSNLDYLEAVARAAGPFEVMELRRIFEPSAAELAASRASANDAASIRAAYERSLKATSLKAFEDADDAFHRAISEACRNVLFDKVYEIVSVVRNETEWGRMKERSLSVELRESHSREHARILEAIEARDGREARQAMIEHLDHVSSMMFSMSS